MQNIKGLHNLFYILFLFQFCDLAKSGFFGVRKTHPSKDFLKFTCFMVIKESQRKTLWITPKLFLGY